jgi:class 3 adenylate cyclase/pimeloyl-ACP methyl ester carboxylesterase
MEPQIQYVRTSDGVDIAYFEVGQGVPLVVLPTIPWSNVQAEFKFSEFSFHTRLASDHRLIRYDVRGAGLSQRGVPDFSLRALQLDLDAVINHLDLDRVSLYAEVNAAKVALAYAAAQPERIHRIILWGGCVRGRDLYDLPRLKAMLSLLEQTDWEHYTETTAQVIFGFAPGEQAREYAAYMRDCVTKDEAVAYFAADEHEDVAPLLSRVSAPALILHPSKAPLTAPLAWARELASSMPHAELKLFESDVLWSKEIEDWLVRSINDFLEAGRLSSATSSISRVNAPEPNTQTVPGTRTFLFTDIVGHTEMMQRLGDAKGREVLREHERITREALKEHGGAEVKTDGDSFMASFASVSSAVECAVALQRAFAQRSETTEEPIVVRMGLNVGEPIEEEGDFFGSAVILGARIKDQAGGGEIVVPEAVRHMLSGKSFLFSDRGVADLKGFEDPVRLYEVRWRE